jgi:hypothetical protein
MQVRLSGFTFIKNGLSLGYPIKESVQSIRPLCDEVIINVGLDDPQCQMKDDGTWEYLNDSFSQDKNIRFIKSYWDPELTSRGLILSQQTNLALNECKGKYCQYIQGDEAISEKDFPLIEQGMLEMDKREEIEGLIFRYLHFYGNTDIYRHTRNVYRREVRLIRNNPQIRSYLDAQGFRKNGTNKIKAKQIDARIFHYGWARKEQMMDKKNKSFSKLYHGSEHDEKNFSYARVWGLREFIDQHPSVMLDWIEKNKNDLEILSLPLHWEWKNIGLALTDAWEGLTGQRIGEYKSFKEIK